MFKLLSLGMILATVSGAAMALQGTLNAQLSQKTTLLQSTLAVHIIGAVVVLVALLVKRDPVFHTNWLQIPWYFYLGGILNVAIIALVAFSIAKLGVSNATTAIIIGQVSMAILVDHMGLFGAQRIPWSPWQIVGLLLFATGAKLLYK